MPNPARPAAAARLKAAWRRRIAEPFLRQLTQGTDPRRLALTLALGSALSLFPVFGVTAPLCLLAGVALGLNQPLIQGVNALCNVIWIPFLIVFIRLGDRLGHSHSVVGLGGLVSLAGRNPPEFLRQCRAAALHAIAGWAVVAPVWIPLVYCAALRFLHGRRAGGVSRPSSCRPDRRGARRPDPRPA